MDLLQLIIIIAVAALAVVGTSVGLLVRSRRTSAPRPIEGRTDAPSGAPTDTLTPPDVLDPGVAAPPVVIEPQVTPTLERPESTTSRLVRLRQRLAGSQGGLGRGLLALLSRDKLDEGS